MSTDYTVKITDRLLRFDTTNDDVLLTLLPFKQTPNAPYEIHRISKGDGHTVTIRVDPSTTDFLLPDRSTTILLTDANPTAMIRIPADGASPAFVAQGGGSGGGGGGGTDTIIGPVTGFTSAGEVGTRYASDPDRLVHLTIGFVPISPVPQPITYFVSADDGAHWTWIGSQRMQATGQQLLVDRLAPGATSTWMMAAVAGNLGGDPSPILDANLSTLYAGVVRSSSFPVLGLTAPAASTGITATIGTQQNVVSADGFTQYGVITGVSYNGGIVGMVYTDPVGTSNFFVRITSQILDSSRNSLAAEAPHGGTLITGGSHSEPPHLITYVPGLAFVRYRFYLANRNSQGGGDFSDASTNTLQMVSYNSAAPADHYDVPITIPPFTPINPDTAFNVTSVTASEVGPKYQDTQQGLHTTIGVVPVIDHDYSSPRTVTIWFDFGTGNPVWQGWYSLSNQGQVVRIGDSTLGTDGVRKSGNIWVPANAGQGNWICYCGAGHLDNGTNPNAYKSCNFTVVPVAPCLPNGVTNAQFLPNPATSDPIDYSKYDPGIWFWEYYCLTFQPPTLAFDPNYWFTLVTIQKGGIIGGVWTQAPDSEGINADPHLNFLGRVHAEINQLPGVSGGQISILKKFGANPATWNIPPAQNEDLTPNPYRTFRFWLYNVSRLGTDTSGSGGAGTYTLQTSCWPGGADHFDLTPVPKNSSLDFRAANPATITAPLTGGNGQPLTIPPYDAGSGTGGIGVGYLGPQSVHAINMAKDSITAANQALAASSVVDPNLVSMGINKVTYGTSIFAGDVVLSRGISLPVIILKNTGIFLYGQADASTGASGLLSKPYVGIQNNAIGLFQGGTGTASNSGPGTGGSVFLDAANAAITIYSTNGDITKPYLTVNSAGIMIVNGVNSFAVNSNAMVFLDTGNKNRIDINSAGITLSNKINADGTIPTTANQLVMLSTGLQFTIAQVAQITVHQTNGITLSNGGTSSVVVTNANVTITASGAQATFSSNQIQMIQGAATVTITAASLKLSNGTSSVEVTSSNVTITNGSLTAATINGGSLTITTSQGIVSITPSTSGVQVSGNGGVDLTHLGSSVISIYTGSPTYGSELSPTTLLVGRFGTSPILTIGLNANDGSMKIGNKTVIDANQVWRESVQCTDHIFGNDFGISGVAVGWPQTSTSAGNPGGPGPGAAQGAVYSFATGAGKTVYVCGGLILNVV
jgi:hypothetical protein